MKRQLPFAIAAAVLASPGVHADAASVGTATGSASVEIVQSASITVVSDLALPLLTAASTTTSSTKGSTGGSATSGVTTTTVTAVSNSTLTIQGQSGDAVSMAVPASIQVIRSGGTEALTVRTNTNSQFGVGGNGVVLGGASDMDTMSVNVGGQMSLASTDALVPGPYEGLLVVVVQYN